MHPCYGWFYNRKNINESLGFANFDYHENVYSGIDFSQLKRDMYYDFLDDYDFFDFIISGYENVKAKDQKYFNFSVTYQNHGPYSLEEQTDQNYINWKDGYTEEEFHIVNNYLSGIADTDEALGYLYDYIVSEEEPIVLFLFGDHKPWLGDNNSVYNMLDISLDLSTEAGAENYYQTPYVILANQAAKDVLGRDFKEEGNTISPMFLMNEFFQYVGLEGPQYLNFLSDIYQEYHVINSVYVGKNGVYEKKEDVTDSELLKEVEQAEYYMKKKAYSD